MAILKSSPGPECTPSEAMSLCSRAVARYQGGEFVAAGGSGLCHRPVDVAFDSAHRQGQSLSDFAVRQPLTDQRHNLSFAVGERHGFASLTKRRSPCTAALLGQRICACRASQRRPPEALAAIREGGLGCDIDGGNEVAHPLEFF